MSGESSARKYGLARLVAFIMTSVLILAVAGSLAFVSAESSGQAAEPQATPTPPEFETAVTFHNNTMADFSATSGEPFIKVDNADRIFVTSPFGFSLTLSLLWRSSDGGRTFSPLGTAVTRDAVTGPGGGDTHLDFDDKNRLYYVDLSAACVTAAVSEDGGNTFKPEQTNPVVCVSDENPGAAADDRQWVAATGDGTAYVTWRNLLSSPFWIFKTKDAGRTWDKGVQLGTVTQSGPLQIDKTKRRLVLNGAEREATLVYQIFYTGNDLRVFRVADVEGQPYVINNFRIFNGGSNSVASVFPVLSVGRDGSLYAVWSQNASTIFMATSTNHGQTWSQPKRVSPFGGTNIMPWVVAGDAGRASVVWYQSPLAGNPINPASAWHIYMAQSLNALDQNASFTTTRVSQNVIHYGEICLRGLNCDISGNDRSFLEYPSVAVDSKGAAVITYNDNSNQVQGPYVMVAKQKTGPSLYNSVGFLRGDPGAVAVSKPVSEETVKTDTYTAEGAHTLPPRNFDRDEAGDARLTPAGANIPALDLRAISMKDDADSVTAILQVADLSTSAMTSAVTASAGDGLLYLVQWDYNDTIYWLGAEVRGGAAVYHTGTLGVIRSGTSKKFITYNPEAAKSLQVQGSIVNAQNGTITMRVPKSLVGNPPAGAEFHTVTGYAMSERGPLAPVGTNQAPSVTSMPIQIDAAAAFTYTAGDGGPRMDGVVEFSLDDANFTAPRQAAFPDPINSDRWQVALSAQELTPGAHTLYARQRVNGRERSPVTAVAFSVSSTIERVVTSLVSLEARNTSAGVGTLAYDLHIRNSSSSQIIFAPLGLRVAKLTSASGRVTVANADNSLAGAGATFGFSNLAGEDGALSPGESSGARRLRFNNPSNEAFTAEFEVVGHVPRASGAGGASASGASSGEGAGGSGSGGTASSTVGALASGVLSVSYNPLTGIVSVELAQP